MLTLVLPEAKGLISATVVRWLVQPRDAVTRGQALVELATEDATLHVEAPSDGVVAVLMATAGSTLLPGAPLAEMTQTGAAQMDQPEPAPSSPQLGGEVVPILMPEAGNSMEEGTILAWKAKPGDTIALGQIICEIETDKATLEYESPAAGRLARIVIADGESIAVKQPIAFLADSDAAVDAWLKGQGSMTGGQASAAIASSSMAKPQAVEIATTIAPSSPTGRIVASPAARKVAKQRSVDLATVGVGSGPNGRILSTDLANARPASPASTDGVRKPMSKMRRAIAANLQASKQTVPHFYVRMTIDADPMLAFYKAQKPIAGCTINDVIVAAVARTMADFPAVRSRIDGHDLIEFPAANIGVAVGVPDGLVVPVIMAADRLPLPQLAAQTKQLVENARKGKVDNMGKGISD